MPRGQIDPTCPRCGYDLQGQVAAWHPAHTEAAPVESAACPLLGTCSECGLILEWKFVLRPSLLGPSWFVESPRQSRGRWSVPKTLLRLVRPERFWREVRLEQPVSWRQLSVFIVGALLLVPLAMTVLVRLQFLIALLLRGVSRAFELDISVWFKVSEAFRKSWDSTVGMALYVQFVSLWPSWFAVALATSLMFAFMLVILPHSRRVSRVRLALVVRLFVYSLAWLPLMFVAACLYGPFAAYVNTHEWTIDDWNYGRGVRAMIPIPTISDCWNCQTHISWHTLILAWLSCYWWFALRDGLRMRHHRVIFACCVVPAVLVGALVLIFNPVNLMWAV